MKKIENIYYTSEDKLGISIMYTIDVKNKLERLIIIKRNKNDMQQKKLSEEELSDKLYSIENLTKDWEEKYENNAILDGIDYKFAIEYGDKTKKIVVGRNKFPNNYSKFLDIIGV